MGLVDDPLKGSDKVDDHLVDILIILLRTWSRISFKRVNFSEKVQSLNLFELVSRMVVTQITIICWWRWKWRDSREHSRPNFTFEMFSWILSEWNREEQQ